MAINLNSPVTVLRGVSTAREKLFSRLGIHTLYDLIHHYPVSHENRGNVVQTDEAPHGEYSSLVLEVITPVTNARIKGGKGRAMTVQKFIAGDDGGGVKMTFFNAEYLKDVFCVGRKFRFYGIVTGIAGNCSMTSPAYEPYNEDVRLLPYVPKYPLTSGLTSKTVSDCVKQALYLCKDEISDTLSKEEREEFGLCTQYDALYSVHFPESEEALEDAKKRLAFDEFYEFQMKIMLLGENGRSGKAYRVKYPDMKKYVSHLPFELTRAQKKAIQDILHDMSDCKNPDEELTYNGEEYIAPARRLVQGDVGSGKTAVASAAVYAAVKSGYQAALMAPTSILAKQHYDSLSESLSEFGIKTALLTGDTKASEKKQILKELLSGEINFLIGTHALIEKDVMFSRLALVITDEQHRFGVEQRKTLEGKSADGIKPHTVVMSATPIPRTLAMIVYCDLDISIIDEMPKGRQKVDTYAVGENMRQRVYKFIRDRVGEGRQCYIVCPLAEEKNADGEYIQTANYEMKSAKKLCEQLREGALSGLRVNYLHGKMKQAEKDEVMGAFARGETDVLVSTTVIEVGVNVPNSVVMLVENAERFGLSQLHQLRGRVGRGEHKSYCILMSPKMNKNKDSDFAKRIGIMCESSDGFKIAEKDLEIRGPGEFFGRRQHGELCFKMADVMRDIKLLEGAKRLASRNAGQTDKRMEIGQIGI